MSMDDNTSQISQDDIDNFINDFYPGWRRHDSKTLSVKEAIQKSIQEDPWNPLHVIEKERVKIDETIIQKAKVMQELKQRDARMQSNPVMYSRADWARHRLQKKLNERK